MSHPSTPPPRPRPKGQVPGWVVALLIAGVVVAWLIAMGDQGYTPGFMVFVGVCITPVLIGLLVVRALKRVGDKPPITANNYLPRVAAPPPGWYLDPQGSGGQRWWTGAIWSDAVRTPPQQ